MTFDILPPEIQYILKSFKKKHKDTFIALFDNETTLQDLSALDIIKILSLCDGVIKKSTKFKVGDSIAAGKAIDNNIFIIFTANDTDVKDYSNKGLDYIIFPNLKNLF